MQFSCDNCSIAQGYFNILPDVGGINQQGVCRVSVSDSSSIFIIGHRYDTIGGGDVKPWLGEFDYQGNLEFLSSIEDSIYSSSFYADKILITRKSGDHYYIYAPRYISGSYYTPYLIEINIRTAKILQSTLIPNIDYPSNMNGLGGICFKNDTISLLSFVFNNNSIQLYITQLDTSFNIINYLRIPQETSQFYPLYFNVVDNHSFEIIGDATLKDKNDKTYVNSYFIYYNSTSDSIYSSELPSLKHLSFNLANSSSVFKTENDSWVIAGHYFDDHTDSCSNCFTVIPYIFSVDKTFKNLLWETEFYDIPYHFGSSYEITSITSVEDGYIASGNFNNSGQDTIPSSGILLKTSINGDSLWMRHYVPLNWNDGRALWTNLQNIKTSQYGSIIVSGEVADKDLQIIRPWMLQLDSNGCLIPDCNTVDVKNINREKSPNKFLLYPNPADNYIYILSKYSAQDKLTINIFSVDCKLIKSTYFTAFDGFQYILPIDELMSGIYYLVILDAHKNILESHSFLHYQN